MQVLLGLLSAVLLGTASATEGSSGGVFFCADKSEELPAAALNDNFCDCKDGMDEPGTSACAGLPQVFFSCGWKDGSTSRSVHTSRVNDGVRDCRNGADEWSG